MNFLQSFYQGVADLTWTTYDIVSGVAKCFWRREPQLILEMHRRGYVGAQYLRVRDMMDEEEFMYFCTSGPIDPYEERDLVATFFKTASFTDDELKECIEYYGSGNAPFAIKHLGKKALTLASILEEAIPHLTESEQRDLKKKTFYADEKELSNFIDWYQETSEDNKLFLWETYANTNITAITLVSLAQEETLDLEHGFVNLDYGLHVLYLRSLGLKDDIARKLALDPEVVPELRTGNVSLPTNIQGLLYCAKGLGRPLSQLLELPQATLENMIHAHKLAAASGNRTEFSTKIEEVLETEHLDMWLEHIIDQLSPDPIGGANYREAIA